MVKSMNHTGENFVDNSNFATSYMRTDMENQGTEKSARTMMPTRKLDELVRAAISSESPQQNAAELERLARELAGKLSVRRNLNGAA